MYSNESREVQSNLVPLLLENKRVGRVHSKFKNGINIQFEKTLVFISYVGSQLTAFGLNIEKNKVKKIINNVRIDDIVIFKENKLTFYNIYEIITINLKEVLSVNLKIPKINCEKKNIKSVILYNFLEICELEKFIGMDLDNKAYKYIHLLKNSDKNNSDLNKEIISYFIGRGKGLTPSGDDILIGFTLTLLAFDENDYKDNWIKDIENLIDSNLTTDISVAYFKSLCNGYSSQQFIELINAIDFKDEENIYKIIKNISNFGHTSGRDTLYGFYLGLNFLINK